MASSMRGACEQGIATLHPVIIGVPPRVTTSVSLIIGNSVSSILSITAHSCFRNRATIRTVWTTFAYVFV